VTYFDVNIEALARLDIPERDALIRRVREQQPLRIIDTGRESCPTLVVRSGAADIALHSTRDPVREAEAWVRSYPLANSSAAILAGFGLGYAAEALLHLYPQIRTLIVIEPDLTHFATACHARDISKILSDSRVRLFAGPFAWVEENLNREIDALISQGKQSDTPLLVHAASLRTLPKEETAFREILGFMRDMRRSTHGTFDKRFRANTETNADAVRESTRVSEFFGKFEGRPMFLIAPGPSLMKHIALLPHAAATATIVAVDSAIVHLTRRGIHPDFAVTMDPQQRVSGYFPKTPHERTRLIFFPGSQPEVVMRFPAERRCAVSTDKESPDSLFLSGSVLLTALDFCLRAGGAPIVLVGTDLAVRPGRTHARGTPYEEPHIRFRARECEGYFGTTATTTESFLLYLRNMEDYIRTATQGRVLWNATEGGAHIAGMQQLSFREAAYRVAGSTLINPC
jgi:hypothetical protein